MGGKKSLFNLLEIRHLVLLEDGTSRQDFHSAPSTPTLPYFFKYLVLNYLFLYLYLKLQCSFLILPVGGVLGS